MNDMLDKEFKTLLIKMLTDVNTDHFNKELENIKKTQSKKDNLISEIKNSIEGINSRITDTEEQISDLEDKIVEITTAEQNNEKN